MSHGYLAIGHGRRPAGTFDPGATSGATWEHTLAYVVAVVATASLRRAGVAVVSEADEPFRTDPNWQGALARARSAGWALEVHFDWSGAPRGTFCLYDQAAGEHLARSITDAFRWVGAPVRPNDRRPELGWLRGLSIPSTIVEVGPVGVRQMHELAMAGELISAGVCNWLEASGRARPRYTRPAA